MMLMMTIIMAGVAGNAYISGKATLTCAICIISHLAMFFPPGPEAVRAGIWREPSVKTAADGAH